MSLSLPLTVKIILDSSSKDAPYVAYCPELDVSSCGPTEEKAKKMLGEAILETFREAAKAGNLEELLSAAGYSYAGKILHRPKVSFEPMYFSVPDDMRSKFQWLA